MSGHDDLLALTDSILRDVEDDARLIHLMNASLLVDTLTRHAMALRAVRDENARLRERVKPLFALHERWAQAVVDGNP